MRRIVASALGLGLIPRRMWGSDAGAGTFGAALLLPRRTLHAAEGPTIEVFKSPTCGCCGLWVEHLEANGFAAKVRDMDDLSQVILQWGPCRP